MSGLPGVLLGVLLGWPARRWLVALACAAGFAVATAVPTDLLDTPLFSRAVPPTWWAWPGLLLSATLAGLLTATYVAAPAAGPAPAPTSERGSRRGVAGGLLTFFAVGCPVCNKLVLVALGSAGAMTWFAPLQLPLQVLALGLLGWALAQRLRGELSCPTPRSSTLEESR